jgi:hypothetical protein
MLGVAKVFVLAFMVCVGGGRDWEESCSEGEAWGASCEVAAAAVREGLREGAELWVMGCVEH